VSYSSSRGDVSLAQAWRHSSRARGRVTIDLLLPVPQPLPPFHRRTCSVKQYCWQTAQRGPLRRPWRGWFSDSAANASDALWEEEEEEDFLPPARSHKTKEIGVRYTHCYTHRRESYPLCDARPLHGVNVTRPPTPRTRYGRRRRSWSIPQTKNWGVAHALHLHRRER
jgi:hypothetical protein